MDKPIFVGFYLVLNKYLNELTTNQTENSLLGYSYTYAKTSYKTVVKQLTQAISRKGLKYLVVVEGERTGKNLHLHMAIGDLPSYVKWNEVDGLVRNAKLKVAELDEQHKVDIVDSGWMEYLTKELGMKDTDNVLWDLA